MKENKTIDRSRGMRIVCNKLEEKGIDLSSKHALEVFAREGDWQTLVYANKVETLEAWEINPKSEKNLKKNLPTAKIRIVDSIEEIKNKSIQELPKFGFVVIDNSQNCYGEMCQYCEHFDLMPYIYKVFDDEVILIFNVNREPHNYENSSKWAERRRRFYGLENTRKISIAYLLKFYKIIFEKLGYMTEDCFNVCREHYNQNDYLYYLVYILKRKEV